MFEKHTHSTRFYSVERVHLFFQKIQEKKIDLKYLTLESEVASLKRMILFQKYFS